MGNEEVQVSCCFAGGVPALAGTAGPGNLGPGIAPTTARATRDDLLGRAEASCTQDGVGLGDWSVIYQQDGAAAAILWFSCSNVPG